MRPLFRHEMNYRVAVGDLFSCIVGFGAVTWAYQTWIQQPDTGAEPAAIPAWLLKAVLAAVTAWIAVVFVDGQASDGLQILVNHFFSAVGLNLIVQYGLAYLFEFEPMPWPVIVSATAVSMALLLFLRKLLIRTEGEERRGILLMGFDGVAEALAPTLEPQVVGVLSDDPGRVSSGLPFLGHTRQLSEVCEQKRPGTILINDVHRQTGISPRELLLLRYAGVAIQAGPMVYERVLHRISWESLRPSDFLFVTSASRNRAALAFQAVYTNVIGLGLLLVSLPLLIVLVVLVTILNSGGPALESIECPGYQQIPFSLLRFRTHRSDGSVSGIGRIVSALHLVNLPHLINVVRGEMALFGPPPVRKIFAQELCRMLPAYPYRFTVKPGILGWSQVNLAGRKEPSDEAERLEYDLYYVKQESPSFDFDIFIRTILRRPSTTAAPEARSEVSGA
jgi:lipopolysaccharide/colanic/teichoic acid biosynthesis glycosyltransferase